jgi:hypothetical protein
MEMFIGSLLVFLLVALGMGVGALLNGRPMHGGCRSLPAGHRCKFESLCGGACRRDEK